MKRLLVASLLLSVCFSAFAEPGSGHGPMGRSMLPGDAPSCRVQAQTKGIKLRRTKIGQALYIGVEYVACIVEGGAITTEITEVGCNRTTDLPPHLKENLPPKDPFKGVGEEENWAPKPLFDYRKKPPDYSAGDSGGSAIPSPQQ